MRHVLRTMGRTGDVETPWTDDDAASIRKARLTFEVNVENGLLAYGNVGNGCEMEQLKEFDPDRREIIFTRKLVGG